MKDLQYLKHLIFFCIKTVYACITVFTSTEFQRQLHFWSGNNSRMGSFFTKVNIPWLLSNQNASFLDVSCYPTKISPDWLIWNIKTIFRRIGDAVEVKKTHSGHAVRWISRFVFLLRNESSAVWNFSTVFLPPWLPCKTGQMLDKPFK